MSSEDEEFDEDDRNSSDDSSHNFVYMPHRYEDHERRDHNDNDEEENDSYYDSDDSSHIYHNPPLFLFQDDEDDDEENPEGNDSDHEEGTSRPWYEWDSMRTPMSHYDYDPSAGAPKECLLEKDFRQWPPQPRPAAIRYRRQTKKVKHSSENTLVQPAEAATDASFEHDQCVLYVRRWVKCTRADRQRFYQAVQNRPYIQRLAIDLSLHDDVLVDHVFRVNEILATDPSRRWRSVLLRGGSSTVSPLEYRNEILDLLQDQHVESLAFFNTPSIRLFRELAPRLVRFTSLHTLCVKDAALHGPILHDANFTEIITRCMSLQNFTFDTCRFQDSQAKNSVVALACGLANVPHLVQVKLAHCWISDDEMCQVVEAFRTHTTLQSLHLNDNTCVQDKSIQAVARLLSPRRGSHLVDLDVSRVWGRYPSADARYGPLFAALARNNRLKHLKMRFVNQIHLHQEDLVLLTDAIRANTTLETLDVANCGLGLQHDDSTRFELLQHALMENRSLHRFWGGKTIWPESNFYPHFNWAGLTRLSKTTTSDESQQSDVPLGLWALVLARVNAKTQETIGSYGSDYSGKDRYMGGAIPKVLYQMLRCPNGERTAGPLAVEFAIHYLQATRGKQQIVAAPAAAAAQNLTTTTTTVARSPVVAQRRSPSSSSAAVRRSTRSQPTSLPSGNGRGPSTRNNQGARERGS